MPRILFSLCQKCWLIHHLKPKLFITANMHLWTATKNTAFICSDFKLKEWLTVKWSERPKIILILVTHAFQAHSWCYMNITFNLHISQTHQSGRNWYECCILKMWKNSLRETVQYFQRCPSVYIRGFLCSKYVNITAVLEYELKNFGWQVEYETEDFKFNVFRLCPSQTPSPCLSEEKEMGSLPNIWNVCKLPWGLRQ